MVTTTSVDARLEELHSGDHVTCNTAIPLPRTITSVDPSITLSIV